MDVTFIGLGSFIGCVLIYYGTSAVINSRHSTIKTPTPAGYIRARKLAKKARILAEAHKAQKAYYRSKTEARTNARKIWESNYEQLRAELFPEELMDEWVTAHIWGMRPRSSKAESARLVRSVQQATAQKNRNHAEMIQMLHEYTYESPQI